MQNISSPIKKEPNPLWTRKQTAKFLQISVPTLLRLYNKGKGPSCYRLSAKTFLYDPKDVMAWLQKQVPEHLRDA